MTPAAGWYPDPSGSSQLRFWDGQAWTSSTADAEQPAPAPSYAVAPPTTYAEQPTYAAQPGASQQPTYAAQPTYSAVPSYDAQSYSAVPQGWGSAPLGPPAHNSRRRKGLIALVAVVVVAAVAATVIPLTSGGHGTPTTAKLTSKLLTADAVGQITGSTFTSAPDTNDDSDDDVTADCKDDVKPPAGAQKADAVLDFNSSGQFAEEELSYTLGSAALFTKEKAEVSACHTMTVQGNRLTFTVLQAPDVVGSDDTFAMQAAGSIEGVPIVLEVVLARFGNGVIEMTYGAANASDASAQIASTSNQLLLAAVAKAKGAF